MSTTGVCAAPTLVKPPVNVIGLNLGRNAIWLPNECVATTHAGEVRAQLTGSIIGNLLLVMGLSALIGGLKNGPQHFSPKIAVSNAALLVLALIGLFVPAIFALTTLDRAPGSITEESVLVSIVLIIGYVLSLIYQFTHPDVTLRHAGVAEEHPGPAWRGRVATVGLPGRADRCRSQRHTHDQDDCQGPVDDLRSARSRGHGPPVKKMNLGVT